MANIITIKVDLSKLEELKLYYSDYLCDNAGEYVYFFAKKDGIEIVGYNGKKDTKKVTFKGEGALEEALKWDANAEVKETKAKLQESWLCLDSQIGSDEVGVGDFLHPMIVVAAYISKTQIPLLKELGIHDSKKINDEKILEIGPKVIKEFKFSKLTLPNEKYNEMILKGENLNSLKAKMHNRALLNLHRDHPEVTNIFIDEFVNIRKYYSYLNDQNEQLVTDIVSKTKGESYFPSVALASVIARYSFLLEVKKLEEKYGLELPLGAGTKANEAAKALLEKLGLDEFNKIIKRNFANYDEVTNIDIL